MSSTHKRVTDFPELLTPVSADCVLVIDKSDTTDGAAGTSKFMELGKLGGDIDRSDGEIAEGVFPTDYSHQVGNILRYGADPTGVADSAAAIQAAINVVGTLKIGGFSSSTGKPLIITQQLYGDVYFPGGYYKVDSTILFRSNIRYWGAGRTATVFDFSAAGAVDAFAPDRLNSYFGTRTEAAHFRDFMIWGDQGLDQSGLSRNGFWFDDTTNSSIDQVEIRCFYDGIHLSLNTGGSYYNRFAAHCIYNYRHLYSGAGCAATTITGGSYVCKNDSENHNDYQIVVEQNDLHIHNGAALEGTGAVGHKLIAHVYSGDGDFRFEGRSEGSPVISCPGNGFNGQLSCNWTGGPSSFATGGFLILTDIEGINPAEGNTSFGSSMDLGFPSGTPVKDLLPAIHLGPLTASGQDGWAHVNPTHGYISWVKDRDDMFLARGGIKMEKIDTSISYLAHNFTWRGANSYAVFLVKLSADAVLSASVTGLTGHSGNFKNAVHIIDYGNSWHLYVASISDYASTDLSANFQWGLTNTSPLGSWAILAHVGMYTGGFPLFPSDDDRGSWVFEEPTKGHPNIGDRIWLKEPTAGAAPGWVCVDRNDTTILTDAAATAVKIYLTSTTGMAVGDKIGIDMDDNTQEWSDIASVSSDGGGAFVTISDALVGSCDAGDNVTTFEMAAMAALA